jgi:hypothetical protein
MAWLQKQNPDINWDSGVWYWRTRTNAEDGKFRLVSASAFVATVCAEGGHRYQLHLADLDLDPNMARDFLMATGPEPTVLEAYEAYARVFSEVDLESMSNHGP